MSHFMRWMLISGCVLLAAGAASAESVQVHNGSEYAIYHFYLSPMDTAEWGPDQLGDQVIISGDSFTLTDIPCDDYDVKLVDEDGDECVVGAPDICGADESWTIENDGLLACQGWEVDGAGDDDGDDGGDDDGGDDGE